MIGSLNELGEMSPYDVVNPIPYSIEEDEGTFIASFKEAEVYASGETIELALDNLKDMITQTYNILISSKEELGIIPKKQVSILAQYLKEKPRDYYDANEFTECPSCGKKEKNPNYPKCWHCADEECDFSTCAYYKWQINIIIKRRGGKLPGGVK